MHGYSPHHQCGTPVPTAEFYPLLDDDAGNQSEHTCTHCGTLHWLFLERSTWSGGSDARLSSQCAATPEISSFHPRNPTTSSQRQYHKPSGSASTFFSTIQPFRLRHLGLRSMKGEEDLQRSISTVNFATGSAPSFHVVETVPLIHSYTHMTRVRPLTIGCNRAERLTRSSWGVYRISSSQITVGLTSSSMPWRCSRIIGAKTLLFNSRQTRIRISAAGTFQLLMKSRSLSLAIGPSPMVVGTLLFTIGMVLLVESVMDPRCTSVSNIGFFSSMAKTGITLIIECPLRKRIHSRQHMLLVVSSTGRKTSPCSSEATASPTVLG